MNDLYIKKVVHLPATTPFENNLLTIKVSKFLSYVNNYKKSLAFLISNYNLINKCNFAATSFLLNFQ